MAQVSEKLQQRLDHLGVVARTVYVSVMRTGRKGLELGLRTQSLVRNVRESQEAHRACPQTEIMQIADSDAFGCCSCTSNRSTLLRRRTRRPKRVHVPSRQST